MELDRNIITSCHNVKTEKDLIELLDKYKGVLSDFMLDYLDSLINLDFSVIKKYISDEHRNLLSELEIYKQIAIYNIYNKALKIFRESNLKFKVRDNQSGYQGVYVCYQLGSDKIIPVFKYCYYQVLPINKVSKFSDIGKISLYQTLESKSLKEVEQYRLLKRLRELYSASVSGITAYRVSKEIRMCEQKYEDLCINKGLAESALKEIEVTNKIHSLMLGDYGLTKGDFKEQLEDKNAHKTFVKRLPHLTIEENIKYI